MLSTDLNIGDLGIPDTDVHSITQRKNKMTLYRAIAVHAYGDNTQVVQRFLDIVSVTINHNDIVIIYSPVWRRAPLLPLPFLLL